MNNDNNNAHYDYGSRLSHFLDKPSISKHIFLIYLLYQMIPGISNF